MTSAIRAGFFSFTEVLEGRHREYNEWHLLDHAPEMYGVDGVRWAQRWVSTPELIDRRLFSQGDLAASQYITLYLLGGPVQGAVEGLASIDRALRTAGRSFDARRTHLSGPFDVVEMYAAPRLALAADAVPFRPNLGVFVTVQDHAPAATEAALDEAREWYEKVHIPDLLSVRGMAGCWWFEATSGGPNPRGRTVRVYWLDEDPGMFLDDLAAKSPGMSMIDLRPAYRTLIVGAYRSVPWPSDFAWFDR